MKRTVKKQITSSIGGARASISLSTGTKFEALTTERSLIDLSVLRSAEWQTITLELSDGGRGLAAHIVNGILVTEPVGALDSVVHMPAPVIFGHVTERCIDTALSGDSVRTSGKQLADAGNLETLSSQTKCSAETGTASTDHYAVILVIDDLVRFDICLRGARTRGGAGLRTNHSGRSARPVK